MRNVFIVLLVIITFSCSDEEKTIQRLTGNAFGTTYAIQYYGDEDSSLEICVDSTIAAVNQSLSTYVPDSDISRINRGEGNIMVDQSFREVFELSKEVHQLSGDYFDPTVGMLRDAYGFGDHDPDPELDGPKLDSLMRYVGFDKVSLTKDNRIVTTEAGIYLDFNAVAKGYGIDRLGDCLDRLGIEHYLIELGGELLGKGRNLSKEKPWSVGIETPGSRRVERSYSDVVHLRNSAMASSGNYRKFRVDSITGKKYVHTINPLTGLAQESDLTSATVIAPTCARADAFATAFMAMGLERSKKVIAQLEDIEVYLTYIDSAGYDQAYLSPGFKLMLAQ